MKWYETEKISPCVTGITDVTGGRSFLISGRDRALLVDTGIGAGDLKDVVDALTALPYDVALTHAHVDHAGGTWAFAEVYLNPADDALFRCHTTRENQRGYIGAIAPLINAADALGEGQCRFLPMREGHIFHLGGLDVEAIAVPGHTPGMTCMLIRQERMLLLGDACNGRVFLFDEEASSVESYCQSLMHLCQWEDAFDTALFSHGPAVQPKTMLHGCIRVAQDILNGRDDRIPFAFMGKSAWLAKAVEADGITRKDGGIGNIVYKNVHNLS